MQSVSIHSATESAINFSTTSQQGRTKAPEALSGDKVDVQSPSNTFADLEGTEASWDSASMKNTLSMIKGEQGQGVHGSFDPARVAQLLAEPLSGNV